MMATAHLPILCRQAEKEAMINNNTKINSMKKFMIAIVLKSIHF